MSSKTVALVTGANKGIGFAIARKLGERGLSVWLGSRDHDRGEKAAAQLRGAGIDAQAIVLDVTDGATIHQATERLEPTLPRSMCSSTMQASASALRQARAKNRKRRGGDIWRVTVAP